MIDNGKGRDGGRQHRRPTGWARRFGASTLFVLGLITALVVYAPESVAAQTAPSPTPSATASPSPTPSDTPSPSASASPSASPSASASASPPPSATASPSPSPSATASPSPSSNPSGTSSATPPPASYHVTRPPGALDPNRGVPQLKLLPDDVFAPPIPSLDGLQNLSLAQALSGVSLPTLDSLLNLQLPSVPLPALDLSAITSLLNSTLQQVLALVNGTVDTVSQLAQSVAQTTLDMKQVASTCGLRCTPCNTSSVTCDVTGFLCVEVSLDCAGTTPSAPLAFNAAFDPTQLCTVGVPPGVCYTLTVRGASGTQTFTLPLCVPIAVSTYSIADTVATVCPVPLTGPTLTNITVPSLQAGSGTMALYLSEQALIPHAPGGADIDLSAQYTLPSTTSTPGATVALDLHCGSVCPSSADVGGTTDYNPTAGGASSDSHDSLVWDVLGPVSGVSVGIAGTGDASAGGVTQAHGVLQIHLNNNAFDFTFSNQGLPQGISVLPPASLAVDHYAGAAQQRISWSSLAAMGFNFSLQLAPNDSNPTHITYKGTQGNGGSGNAGFTVNMVGMNNGVQTSGLTQQGLGPQFSSDIDLPQDASGSTNGVTVNSSPNDPSTITLKSFANGMPSDEVEVAGLKPQSSQMSLSMASSAAGSGGVAVSGTQAPSAIGAMVWRDASGNVSNTVQSSLLIQQNNPAALPDAITSGVANAVTMVGTDPSFQLNIAPTGSNSGSSSTATGVAVSASTQDPCNCVSQTARQLTITSMLQPSSQTAVTFVLNSIAQQASFNFNAHGTATAPTGFDLTQSNVPDQPSEFKQILVRQAGNPIANIQVQRSSSDTTGAIAPGSATSVLAMDPPQNFSLSGDYTSTGGAMQAHVTGQETTASGGYIQVSASGINVNLANDFVAGKYSLDINGETNGTRLTGASMTLSQGTGANHAGSLSITAPGAGHLVLNSFATSTTGKASFVFDNANNPIGAHLHASNSEDNPGLSFGVANTGTAFSLDGPSASPPVSAPAQLVLHNAPQNADGGATRTTDSNGTQHFSLDVENTSPQANEYITADAPLDSTHNLHAVVSQMDTSTSLNETYSNTSTSASSNGTSTFGLQSQNVNANSGESISETVVDSSGAAVDTLFFAGPNSSVATPAAGSQYTLVWRPMPSSYKFTLSGSSGTDKQVTVDIANASPDSATFQFTDAPDNVHLLLAGTAANQHAKIEYNGGTQAATISGTIGPGTGVVEAYILGGKGQDHFLVMQNAGPIPVASTDQGTDVTITPPPGATAYDETLGYARSVFTFNSQNGVAGAQTLVQEWFQNVQSNPALPANNQLCYANTGAPLECDRLDFIEVPAEETLKITMPGAASTSAPNSLVDYNATDSNMIVQIAVLPSLSGPLINAVLNGLPSGGLDLELELDNLAHGQAFQASTYVPGQSLPATYVEAWNVSFGVAASNPGQTIQVDPNDAKKAITISYGVQLTYVANIVVSLQPGLTSARGVYTASAGVPTIEVTTAGVSSSTATLELQNLHLSMPANQPAPNMFWRVQLAAGLASQTDQDSFQFSLPSQAELALYSWEKFPNDNVHQYAASGCAASTAQVVDSDLKVDSYPAPIPFTPTFPQEVNSLQVCGGHTAYFAVNPQDLMFEHCNGGWYVCDSSDPYFRYAHVACGCGPIVFITGNNFTSDWIYADGVKMEGADPNAPAT
jgi:hypothetical protein